MHDRLEENEFTRLLRKAERLSAGVLLVADTIPETEELRTRIKVLSIELMSKCANLKSTNLGNKIKNISEIESTVLNISSFLHASEVLGLVSPMNASIIKEDIGVFLAIMKSYSNAIFGISERFLKEKMKVQDFPESPSIEMPVFAAGRPLGQSNNGDNHNGKSTRKDVREKMILDFIKNRDSVNIKDISRNVKGCSEKTIQRELIKMIENGLISKTGERRWTRYSYIK